MGIHVNPWLIHVNVWQKPLQYCKVISLQLIKKNKKERKEEKGTTEDEKLDGITNTRDELEQCPGVGGGQGNLAWRSPRGQKESGMTEWLNWTEKC